MMSAAPTPKSTDATDLSSPFRHVEPDEFCRLVVSMRPLQRRDDPEAGLRGLEDTSTGEQFYVEDVRLSSFLASRRPR
ncbi:MAG: hypothetical protein U0939_15275 [Pirellulales bacterium]